jgi:hypothetical protein
MRNCAHSTANMYLKFKTIDIFSVLELTDIFITIAVLHKDKLIIVFAIYLVFFSIYSSVLDCLVNQSSCLTTISCYLRTDTKSNKNYSI